jgi:aryl-alcohol dehydrogenase-like predicted oxidoreductase
MYLQLSHSLDGCFHTHLKYKDQYMQNKRLGNSGLHVSDLSLGTMLFGEESGRSTPEDEAIRMVHAYIDSGGNHIDTADVYAGGRSEEIIARALKGGLRQKVTLATKVRFGDSPEKHTGAGLSRHVIMGQVEGSLRRLETDVIDLYYMHGWDPHTPIAESLRAFDDLVRDGKIRYVGVSNFKAWQVMQALGLSEQHGWARFIAGQYQYSLVVRDIEYEFSSLFADQGIGCIAWGPLGGGFLSGKYRRDERPTSGRIADTPDDSEEAWDRRATERNWRILEAVEQIAQEREATVPQIALAWLRAQPIVSSVIIGARTLPQLEDNLMAAKVNLTAEELATLDEASTLPELYPYRMMQSFGMEA